jgi:hypothetical protein
MSNRSNGKHNGHGFQLRDNVPVPGATIYPFADMKAGQSFHIPNGISVTSLRTAASQFAKRKGNGVKFTIRREPHGPGYGCWRVK